MKKNGFTLIELLVAIAILGAISIISTQMLWSTVSVRSKQNSIEDASDNIRQILSQISKSLTTAKSYTIPNISTIQITGNPCRTFWLESSKINLIELSEETCVPAIPAGSPSVTDPKIEISKLEFTQSHQNVSIKIEGKIKDNLGEHHFNYQTSAAPRTYL